MPERPNCIEMNCTNLAKKGRLLSTGHQSYSKMCHSHLTAHLKEAAKNEIISPEVLPSSYSRPFRTWVEMRRRINNPQRKHYERYGGRGLKYDPRWEYFSNFWQDMGKTYSDNLSLDRIDNDKGYYKDNCRWADSVTQMNNRNGNHKLTYDGKTMGISEWSRYTGIKRTTIKERIMKYGWSIERALSTEVIK